MPLYEYKAIEQDGNDVKGMLDAYDLDDLRSQLKQNQLFLKKAKVVEHKKPNMFFALSSKTSKTKIVLFIRQLSVMIDAGIAVEDAIKTLRNQEEDKALKNALVEVYDDILKGEFLSDALGKHPKIFPPFFKNMMYVGEISGNLPRVLNKLADYYERDLKIKSKAKNSMIYPMFLGIIIVLVFIFLLVFIVPKFEDMISEMGGEVPVITQIVMNMSYFFRNNYIFIIIALLIVGSIGYLFFNKTKKGIYLRDKIKLSFPIIRKVNYYLITTRFSRGFAVLTASGITVLDAMETTGKLMENKYFEKKFEQAIDDVKKGKKITRAVASLKFFPQMLIEMLSVGEQTGRLDNVLEKTADYFDDRVEQSIARAVAALEPMIIIIAGFLVGFVILAVLLPLIAVLNTI